eukprot:gene9692-1898_t
MLTNNEKYVDGITKNVQKELDDKVKDIVISNYKIFSSLIEGIQYEQTIGKSSKQYLEKHQFSVRQNGKSFLILKKKRWSKLEQEEQELSKELTKMKTTFEQVTESQKKLQELLENTKKLRKPKQSNEQAEEINPL